MTLARIPLDDLDLDPELEEEVGSFAEHRNEAASDPRAAAPSPDKARGTHLP